MPKLTFGKEQLQGKSFANPPAGIYEFTLDGFSPKAAKVKDGKTASVNLRPTLRVVNHPTLTGSEIFTWCNTNFPAELYDLCHSVGVPFDGDGSDNASMPGEFVGPDDEPSQWSYIGPLVGQVGKLEIGETTDQNGKPTTAVKKYFCRVQGCTAEHRDSLLRT